MPTLEVKSLTKRYGSTVAVDDVTFAIEPGEIFGYLGPNGSGKTTTIRCIMGLLRPTRGQVHVLGRRVRSGRATEHARIGYLPGEFRLWKFPRGRRSLHLLAALGGRDHARKRRMELAERLDLDLNRRVGELSKGNRQKVGVLFAFQHEPEVLVLDEPTGGLDPLLRQIVLDLIREAADAGAAVLLSSHDLSEVSAICGRAGILRQGKLVELAPISQIVQQGRRRLKVWFADGTPVPPIPAEQFRDVHLIQRGPGLLDLAYHGSADPLLKWLAQFPVERIATPQTSLEEAFMQYYQVGSAPAGVVARTLVSEGGPS
ncbi:MAG: ABC transporter ATP-binding protein [Phycisphaerales bacterium]|nr:MAG: ABC transporter ATP-binding protein [Phycisphaerales bacterium]